MENVDKSQGKCKKCVGENDRLWNVFWVHGLTMSCQEKETLFLQVSHCFHVFSLLHHPFLVHFLLYFLSQIYAQHNNEDEDGTLLNRGLEIDEKICSLGLGLVLGCVVFGRVVGTACGPSTMLGDRVKAVCVHQVKRVIYRLLRWVGYFRPE